MYSWCIYAPLISIMLNTNFLQGLYRCISAPLWCIFAPELVHFCTAIGAYLHQRGADMHRFDQVEFGLLKRLIIGLRSVEVKSLLKWLLFKILPVKYPIFGGSMPVAHG